MSRGRFRLTHHGGVYPLPLPDGPGKALRPLIVPGDLPVYVAALGPRNLRLTGEVADGWLGNTFIPELADVFLDPIVEGAAEAGQSLGDIDLVAPVALEFTDTDDGAADRARVHADGYAFTIGAMGTGRDNFYNNAFARLGYADAVGQVAAHWHCGSCSHCSEPHVT